MVVVTRAPPVTRQVTTIFRLATIVVALGIAAAVLLAIALSLQGTVATELAYRFAVIADLITVVMLVIIAVMLCLVVRSLELRSGPAMPPRTTQPPLPPPAQMQYSYPVAPPTPLLQPPPPQPSAPQPLQQPGVQERRAETTTEVSQLLFKPAMKTEEKSQQS